MSDVESLKKQAKTYDEVHSIQAKVNHAIYKMIPTSTQEGEGKLKDKIKERDKKQWFHEDVVLKQIADLKQKLKLTIQDAKDFQKIAESRSQVVLELEGRLQAIQKHDFADAILKKPYWNSYKGIVEDLEFHVRKDGKICLDLVDLQQIIGKVLEDAEEELAILLKLKEDSGMKETLAIMKNKKLYNAIQKARKKGSKTSPYKPLLKEGKPQ